MKRVAGVLALMLVVSLLAASDVPGFALVGAGKTTGPSLIATVVADVTGGISEAGKGVATSVRVQKASKSAAVIFNSSYINSLPETCVADDSQAFPAITDFRFAGCTGGCLVNGWIDDPTARQALLSQFGIPAKAAILDTDYAACTTQGGRQILSFTAVIQFQP